MFSPLPNTPPQPQQRSFVRSYSTTSVNYGELGGVPLSTLVVAAALLKTVLLACGAVKLARAGLGRAPGAGSGARTDAAGSSAVKKKD